MYVRYTYTDCSTGIPVSEEPARTGPIHPEGISFIFASSTNPRYPILYGRTEKDSLQSWMKVITEEELFEEFKAELLSKTRSKRKEISSRGVEYKGTVIPSDTKDTLSHLLQTLSLLDDSSPIDFEVSPSQWEVLDKEDIKSILSSFHLNTQRCFSWSRATEERISHLPQSHSSLDSYRKIEEEINNFTLDSEDKQ